MSGNSISNREVEPQIGSSIDLNTGDAVDRILEDTASLVEVKGKVARMSHS